MRQKLSIVLIMLVCLVLPSQAEVVYTTNFENWELSPNWSFTTDSKPYLFSTFRNETFLGLYNERERVAFHADLPTHQAVKLSFDLYIVGGWGNTIEPVGRDIWGLSLNDSLVFKGQFRNVDATNATKRSFANLISSGSCRLVSEDTLLLWFWDRYLDSIYHVEIIIPDTSTDFNLLFGSGTGSDNYCLKTWGIDNFTVSTVPEPSTITSLLLGLIAVVLPGRKRR